MPRYDRRRRGWYCSQCGAFYTEKTEAQLCESRHRALADWAADKIDELGVAQAFGWDVSTPEGQAVAIQRVRDMTTGGQDLGQKTPVQRPFVGGMGTPVGMTSVHGGGRTQIPVSIRSAMGLKDGDNVMWYMKDGRFYIAGIGEMPYWDKPKGFYSPPR